MTIGGRIRDARKAAGLTQRELAQKLGVRNTTVSKWESGAVRQIPTERLMALAGALGETPSGLLGWDMAKSRMESAGVTVNDLSEELGLPRRSMEKAVRNGLAGADEIVSAANALAAISEDETRLLALWRRASADDQAIIRLTLKKYE
jgi:transcriptional regulator with XRE-family HTH domain